MSTSSKTSSKTRRLTPLGAVSRGLVAGAVGTVAMDALLFARYKRGNGTSDFADEHYEDAIVTDSAGTVGGLSNKAWKTGEGIALGEYGDVDTTPGPLATAPGLGASSAFSVFWSREN